MFATEIETVHYQYAVIEQLIPQNGSSEAEIFTLWSRNMQDSIHAFAPVYHDEQEEAFYLELIAFINNVLDEIDAIAGPLLTKHEHDNASVDDELGEKNLPEFTLEDAESLRILTHILFHCNRLLLHPTDPEYDELLMGQSKEELALLSQLVVGYESVAWQNLGKALGVVAVVAALGLIAITPIGGVSFAAFIGALVVEKAAFTATASILTGVAISSGFGGFFAHRYGQQPTGLSKSILDVSHHADLAEPEELFTTKLKDR